MAQYTTVSKVRSISGLKDTTNISSELISSKIDDAMGIVNDSLSSVYTIPFTPHYQNSITFSGTATATGTLVITVNSVAYNVSVVNGDSASTVADKFRSAALTSVDFVTDSVGAGEKVTFISKNCDTSVDGIAQVTINNIVDVAGITTAQGIVSESYPKTIEWITAEIAASLLLRDNFGLEAQDTPKDGNARLAEAMEFLRSVQDQGETQPRVKIMDDICGVELTVTDDSVPLYEPNETTNSDTSNSTLPKFGINDKY